MVALAYLKLVRFPILVLLAAIQYCTRYFIIKPILAINGYELIMSDLAFGYVVLSTVLIAAGGYAINDYFDAKLDRVNKPKTVVLDRLIKRRVAMALHIVLSAVGVLIAAYVSYSVGLWKLTSLFVFAVFSLWFYSTNLKHQLILGNVIIAALGGFAPLLVGLYEIPLQNAAHPEIIQELGFSIFNVPAYWVLGYSSIFAILTLLREITKDVVDIRGDKFYGANTIPIKFGVLKTKIILIALYILAILLVAYLFSTYLSVHSFWFKMCVAGIILGLFIQPFLIFSAKTKTEFARLVQLNNMVVVLVVISMVAIKYSIEAYFQ